MRCPSCGHENSNLATRCAACGSALPTDLPGRTASLPGDTAPLASDKPGSAGPLPGDTAPLQGDTAPMPSGKPASTAERPQVGMESPAPSVDKGPGLQELVRSVGAFASAKSRQAGGFFRSHQRALGVVLALFVAGALAAIWLVIYLFDVPSYTQIENDMAQLLPTYEYMGGTYGPDLQIPLSNVAVTKRSGSKTPEGMQTDTNMGSGAYGVEAEATYDDGRIRVVRDVATTYVRNNDSWNMVGELTERGMSFSARAGVDENKVLANIGTILDAASTGTNESLADVYQDGTFSIVANSFKEPANKDTAVNDVVIRCVKEEDFCAYEGSIAVRFAFESGSWVLRSAVADDKATTRGFTPLVGTWTGSLVSSVGVGATCYGARDAMLTINIDSVGDPSAGGGRVQGTVSALAHFHQKPDKDQDSSTDDVMLDNVAFSGVVQNEFDEQTGSKLTLECTTTGNPNSELSFSMSFGTSDDPSAVFARVTSTHTYEERFLLLIPHQTMAKFVDTYQLSRS